MNENFTNVNKSLQLQPIGDARFSEDGVYRWWLTRKWGEARQLLWVMLNPSIATATLDDQTVRRCVDHSKRWGWGSVMIVNLYALRSTNPKNLWGHPDPVGSTNDEVLNVEVQRHKEVMLAWGALPKQARRRSGYVLDLAWEYGNILWCPGKTKEGYPRHPSRSPNIPKPIEYKKSTGTVEIEGR